MGREALLHWPKPGRIDLALAARPARADNCSGAEGKAKTLQYDRLIAAPSSPFCTRKVLGEAIVRPRTRAYGRKRSGDHSPCPETG